MTLPIHRGVLDEVAATLAGVRAPAVGGRRRRLAAAARLAVA